MPRPAAYAGPQGRLLPETVIGSRCSRRSLPSGTRGGRLFSRFLSFSQSKVAPGCGQAIFVADTPQGEIRPPQTRTLKSLREGAAELEERRSGELLGANSHCKPFASKLHLRFHKRKVAGPRNGRGELGDSIRDRVPAN